MSMVNYIVDGELYHHGIKGQRWGDRNYQYQDGSLTPEGKRRYYGSAGLNRFRFGDAKSKPKTKEEKEMAKANSAYRVERHKAKMERKTQEALNKEKIKQAQSNAKRSAEISKLKGNKPSTQVKKEDGEEKRNDKNFEKNVKKLLTAKKIKDYSKYTKEELEEAASRKEAANRMDAERRKSTKFGRAQEFFNSPAGQTILNTATKEAISGLSKMAESWGKQAIQSYLSVNAKEMYERSIDRKGWEEKKATVAEKLSAETSKAKAQAAQEWRKVEGEELKNESQSMKNKQQKIDNDHNNAEYEARAGVRKASNKAEEEKFKSEAEAYKASGAKSKTAMSEEKTKQTKEQTKQAKEQTKQEEEMSKQKFLKGDREKGRNDIGQAYANERKIKIAPTYTKETREAARRAVEDEFENQKRMKILDREEAKSIAYGRVLGTLVNRIENAPRINASANVVINGSSNVKVNQTSNIDTDIETIMKFINSKN